MGSVCNAWKSHPKNRTRMLFLWCVLIHTVKKRWLSICNRNLYNCVRISFLAPLHIDIFATGKHVNHGEEYGLEISTIFHFYVPKKAINDVRYREMPAIKCPLHRGFTVVKFGLHELFAKSCEIRESPRRQLNFHVNYQHEN